MVSTNEIDLKVRPLLIILATEGLKALLLLNGGAMVAILAYLGQVSGRARLAPLLSLPMIFFILGLALAGAAYFGAYFAQLTRYNLAAGDLKARRREFWWMMITIGLSSASLILFSCGAWAGVHAFSPPTDT